MRAVPLRCGLRCARGTTRGPSRWQPARHYLHLIQNKIQDFILIFSFIQESLVLYIYFFKDFLLAYVDGIMKFLKTYLEKLKDNMEWGLGQS